MFNPNSKKSHFFFEVLGTWPSKNIISYHLTVGVFQIRVYILLVDGLFGLQPVAKTPCRPSKNSKLLFVSRKGATVGLSCCIFQLWVCGVGRKKVFRSCNNIYLVVSSSFNQIKVMLIPPLPFCRHHSYNACNVHGRMFRKLKIISFILSTLTWLMHVAGCCMLKMILHDFSSSQMLNVW